MPDLLKNSSPSLPAAISCDKRKISNAERAFDVRSHRYSPKSTQLTHLQWLVSQLISCGLGDKEIAFFLNLSEATVKCHSSNTLKALGLSKRTQIVRYIFETGQFDPEKASELLNFRYLNSNHQ